MGENLQNYEVVLTTKATLCYYIEAESEQVALDEVVTAWAEGDYGVDFKITRNGGIDHIYQEGEIIDKVAHVMEQY